MAQITRIESGPKLSRAVIHGDTVYLCGQVAHDLSGSIEEQTRLTLARIEHQLALAGSDKSKLLYATVFLKDIRHADAMNTIWIEWLTGKDQPARTCVQAVMGLPEILVEITCVAAR